MKQVLHKLFLNLDQWVEEQNITRDKAGTLKYTKIQVTILGQMSLLVDDKVSATLNLARTGDLDAKLQMEFSVKTKMKELLAEQGLIYDEDSDKIFIPKGSKILSLFEYKNINVKRLDPESALVSKAVKSPTKNKQLLRQVIAKNSFPNLVERIEANGGDITIFLKETNEEE